MVFAVNKHLSILQSTSKHKNIGLDDIGNVWGGINFSTFYNLSATSNIVQRILKVDWEASK